MIKNIFFSLLLSLGLVSPALANTVGVSFSGTAVSSSAWTQVGYTSLTLPTSPLGSWEVTVDGSVDSAFLGASNTASICLTGNSSGLNPFGDYDQVYGNICNLNVSILGVLAGDSFIFPLTTKPAIPLHIHFVSEYADGTSLWFKLNYLGSSSSGVGGFLVIHYEPVQ